MLHDLDETIKQILVAGVPLDLSEIDVAFDAPTAEWSASLARPTVNCYLYHVVENHDLRQYQWQVDQTARPGTNGASRTTATTRRRTPFRIDCCYMITAWANDAADAHRLLWRVLATLLRHAVLPREHLQGILAEQEWPMPAKIAQPEGPLKNPSDFWANMEGPIRAGFNYIVTMPLEPELVENVPLVLTRRVSTRLLDNDEVREMPLFQIGGWVLRDGQPVARAEVEVVERALRARTDSRGRFAFMQVPRGQYTLRAESAGIRGERTVEVPGTDYDLSLPPQSAAAQPDPDATSPGPAPGGARGRRR